MGASLSTQYLDVSARTIIIGVALAAPLSVQMYKHYCSKRQMVDTSKKTGEGDANSKSRELLIPGTTGSGDSVSEHSQSTAGSTSSTPNLQDDIEFTAQKLMKRAAESSTDHAEQVKIAETLFSLGQVLMTNKDYKGARHVLHQAEALQHHVVHDTIQAVAAAMDEQSEYYKKINGKEKMAERYQHTASDLRERTTPRQLSVAWMVHNKCEETNDEELNKIKDKVEKRLKRASQEAIPLSKMLKRESSALRLEVEAQQPESE